MDKFLKVIGVAFLTSASLVLILPVGVLFGYLAGLVLKIFCGTFLANGLNLLFNSTRFSPEHIPLICGTLAAFAGYLRTTVTTKNS